MKGYLQKIVFFSFLCIFVFVYVDNLGFLNFYVDQLLATEPLSEGKVELLNSLESKKCQNLCIFS